MTSHTIDHSTANTRLDNFVFQHVLPDLTRSAVQKLIEQDKVHVNDAKVKMGYRLREGDLVTIDFTSDELKQVPDINLPIVYEDKDCIVIDKPVGILTHSKGVFNPEATVATFIARKVQDMEGDRAGIVHRLDRATSGVMICAKNPVALSWLQKQFSQRKTKKTYTAIITSGLEPTEAIIDMPIERDPSHPKQFRVGSGGRSAQTAYKITSSSNHYSRVELKPVTGRTHQLRVHLKQLNHPIVGDTLYGGQAYERLLLHASELELTLPNRERKVFSSKLPAAFSAIMK